MVWLDSGICRLQSLLLDTGNMFQSGTTEAGMILVSDVDGDSPFMLFQNMLTSQPMEQPLLLKEVIAHFQYLTAMICQRRQSRMVRRVRPLYTFLRQSQLRRGLSIVRVMGALIIMIIRHRLHCGYCRKALSSCRSAPQTTAAKGGSLAHPASAFIPPNEALVPGSKIVASPIGTSKTTQYAETRCRLDTMVI